CNRQTPAAGTLPWCKTGNDSCVPVLASYGPSRASCVKQSPAHRQGSVQSHEPKYHHISERHFCQRGVEKNSDAARVEDPGGVAVGMESASRFARASILRLGEDLLHVRDDLID